MFFLVYCFTSSVLPSLPPLLLLSLSSLSPLSPPSLPLSPPFQTSLSDAYELLKENLMTRDDAVVGEAAGLSMGLVMLGTHSPQAIEDMTNVS